MVDGYLGLKPYNDRKLPIYVGGYGPRMLRLVAALSDGWIPWMNSPEPSRKISQR